MAKLKVILLDNDILYLQSFQSYILKNFNEKIDLYCFSDFSILKNSTLIKNKEKSDILLISETLYDTDSIDFEKISDCTMVLVEGENIIIPGTNVCINKYMPADILCESLLSLAIDKVKKNINVKSLHKNTKIIAVYSPAGGIGKSTLSASLATICSHNNLKSLYVNFEEIPSTLQYLQYDNENSFSDVLYYSKEKNINILTKLESLKVIDERTGVEFFAPQENFYDLFETDEQDIEYLFDNIKLWSYYDFIFVDLPTSLNKNILKIMEISDYILLLVSESQHVKQKIKKFFSDLLSLEEREKYKISKKILKVLVKNKNQKNIKTSKFNNYNNSLSNEYNDCNFVIPYITELENNNLENFKEISLNGYYDSAYNYIINNA